jgi:hypothetical protein
MLYYSKSTNGFYDDALSLKLPGDAVQITEGQHQSLLDAQSNGHIIAADATGKPTAVAPSLQQLQATRLAELRKSCRDTLLGGFTSTALGVIHSYPSTETDQQNLRDALLTSISSPALESPLWCTNSGGWKMKPHTALQVEQVHSDWIAFRIAQQQRLLLLQTSANMAASAEALAAITW